MTQKKRDPLKNNHQEKHQNRGPLVRLQPGSQPEQTSLTIYGLTTRTFPRPLLLTTPHRAFPRPIVLTTPRVVNYSDDMVFLSHPPHFMYQLPAPLPDNFIIIAITMSVWIVLFM